MSTDSICKLCHILTSQISPYRCSFVIIASIRFGLQAGFYALISLYVSTIAMDGVIKGFNTAMQFMIITRNPASIISRSRAGSIIQKSRCLSSINNTGISSANCSASSGWSVVEISCQLISYSAVTSSMV